MFPIIFTLLVLPWTNNGHVLQRQVFVRSPLPLQQSHYTQSPSLPQGIVNSNLQNLYVPQEHQTCVTPSRKPGRCLPQYLCPELTSASANPQIAKESVCGMDKYLKPKICCPARDLVLKPIRKPKPTPVTTPPTTMKGDSSKIIFPDSVEHSTMVKDDGVSRHPNRILLPDSCGVLAPGFSGFGGDNVDYSQALSPELIVGGTDAGLGTQPWMVLIGYIEIGDNEIQYACGGTLINSQYVLTAAHCIPSSGSRTHSTFKLAHIRVGEYDQRQDPDCVEGLGGKKCGQKLQITNVDKIIMHPDYNSKGKTENDIALIRLQTKVTLGSSVAPICLPLSKSDQDQCSVQSRQNYKVTGWGRYDPGKIDGSNVLQILDVPPVSHTQCQSFYEPRIGQIDNTRFCAGGIGGQDSCQGDSGGPITRKFPAKNFNNSPRSFQCGVISLGGAGNCATADAPALYTNVAHYVPWILNCLRP